MPIKDLDLDLSPKMRSGDVRAKRRVLSRVLEGSWTAMLKGRGMEFAGFRQYTYGDDASRIDWNATLRAKEVLVREYEEFKTINVFFLLDVSDSMLFTSQKRLKCEYAAELLFNLAAAIADAGDNVGYAIFSDHIIAKQMPGLGREVVYRMVQDLENGKNYGGKSDFKKVMTFVNSLLREKSLIILISDYIALPEGWEKYIQMFSVSYDLIGIMVRDPHDFALPKEGLQVVVRDPENPNDELLVDLNQYAAAFEDETQKEETYIRSVFEKARASFLKVDTSHDPYDSLLAFFKKRAKVVRA
ncbi:DUF58 domain-containing protein [Candidatus Woesearchaeota archaeon]|nr:DUF58 domain-containing protein [Candidatus Woesearchaeota archaeon]